MDALPPALVDQIKAGNVNLDDPATTLALLKINAVVGATGFFNADGSLKSIGLRCAVCHSTVDDAFSPGIGHRLDGWGNRDLNVGAITALAHTELKGKARGVLSWIILCRLYIIRIPAGPSLPCSQSFE